MNPLVVNLAPTGMIPTRQTAPHAPLSPAEIAEDVSRCAGVGLSAVHVHARDPQGAPTYRKSVYADIISRIRESTPDVLICVSCSGRTFTEFEQRSEVLDLSGDLKPDLASLTLSSLNFARSASVNAPDTVRRLAEMMRDNGIKPELEAFDLGMVNYAVYLAERDVLEPPFSFNLFFGNVAGAQADLVQMGAMLAAVPANSLWSFAGIGAHQLTANSTAIAMGGGVRVGLEDNLYFGTGDEAATTNEQLVRRVVTLGALHGRPVMHPAALAKQLQLPGVVNEATSPPDRPIRTHPEPR